MNFSLKKGLVILVSLSILFAFTSLEAKKQNLRGTAQRDFRGAQIDLQGERYDRALGLYLEVLASAPQHVESMKNVADLYFMRADFLEEEEAREIFEIAYGYYKGTIENILNIPDWKNYTDNSGKTSFEAIKSDAELKLLSIFAKIFRMGQELFTGEDYDTAEEIFNGLLVLYPDRTESYQMLAAISDKQGDTDKAIEYSLKILEVDPTNTQILVNLALEFEAKKDWERAKHYYMLFSEVEPDNVSGYLSIAYVNMEMQNFQEALQNYEVAMTIEPENADILLNAISVSQSLGNDDKIIDLLLVLIGLEATEENYYFLCSYLAKNQRWADLLTYGKAWHEAFPTVKDALQFIIAAAQQTNDQATFRQYQDILSKMR